MQITDIRVEIPDVCYDALLTEQRRYTILKGGRGSGKSHSVARALILLAMEEPHRILCTREVQRSIKDSVHRLLSDCIKSMGVEDEFVITESEIRGLNGSLFIFSGISTQTVDSIKSLEGVSICWVEEAQSISERSWSMLIPTIRAKGSRFFITMNPQLESDPTSQRFLMNSPPDCVVITMNWSQNPWFPKELDLEREYHRQRDPDTYAHIWEGAHLPAVSGAVYFREMQRMELERRIRPVPVDPLLKVHTVWDLGVADQTAIIMCQVAGSEIRIIDYIQDNNRALSSYVQELNERKYNWGDDFVPHDASHRHFTSGISTSEMMSQLGRNPYQVPNIDFSDGLEKTREVFSRVFIDETKCQPLVDCLKRYRWNVPANGQSLGMKPVHDEASHGADSFRYMCIASGDMRNESWGGPIDYSQMNRAII